jgi:hypothetical protein
MDIHTASLEPASRSHPELARLQVQPKVEKE